MTIKNSSAEKDFMKLVKDETHQVKKTYEQAKKAYETVLKNFLVNNVTGKKDFNFFHKIAKQDMIEFFDSERGPWAVEELEILEAMILDYIAWLRDSMLEIEDKVPQ